MKKLIYKRLNINDKFFYNGIEYTKIKPVYKNCCIQEYNSESSDGQKVLIPDHTEVEVAS